MARDSGHAADTMQIGEVARLTSLTVDTIRFYEGRGLLPKVSRTAGRFRLYSNCHVARLGFIRQMEGLGFSLHEIKELLELREHRRDDCPEVMDLLKARLENVRSKIRKLERLERELARSLYKCNRELNSRKSTHRGTVQS